MEKKVTAFALLCAVWMLCGCGKKESCVTDAYSEPVYASAYSYDMDAEADFEAAFAYEESAPVNKSSQSKNVSESGSEIKRMIRKTASITITVMDPIKVMDEIISMTDEMGGFTVSSSNSQEYYSDGIYLPYADITIRVPSERLTEALSIIEGFTTDKEKDVKNKKITGTDITSDYVDTGSRLTSLQKTLDKLYEILDTAKNAEEALEVYTEIASIEGDIEVLKGQMKYMEESVSLSSITIRVNSLRPEVVSVAAKWEPLQVIKDAFAALLEGGKNLIEVLIYVVIVGLPLIALIAVFVILIIKLVKKIVRCKRKHASRKSTDEKDK